MRLVRFCADSACVPQGFRVPFVQSPRASRKGSAFLSCGRRVRPARVPCSFRTVAACVPQGLRVSFVRLPCASRKGSAFLSCSPPRITREKFRNRSVYSITHSPLHCKSFLRARARDTILIWQSDRCSPFFRLTIFLARQQECPLLFIEKRATRRWLFFIRNDFRTDRQQRLRSFRPRNES